MNKDFAGKFEVESSNPKWLIPSEIVDRAEQYYNNSKVLQKKLESEDAIRDEIIGVAAIVQRINQRMEAFKYDVWAHVWVE